MEPDAGRSHAMCAALSAGLAMLQAVPGVAQLPDGYNPATWMLEVSGGGSSMRTEAAGKVDFVLLYRDSRLCKLVVARADEVAQSARADGEPLTQSSQYAASFMQQAAHLTVKLALVYWCGTCFWLHRRADNAVLA